MQTQATSHKQQSSELHSDAIELIPSLQSANSQQLKASPSRVSNTLEHQMQLQTDPWKPRGEPQLVGLTRIKYAGLPEEPCTEQPSQNYIYEAQHFYPNKQASKRINQLKQNSKKLSQCAQLIQCRIQLPQPMLIEQINLYVTQQNPKVQSDFSHNYQLVSVIGDSQELALKSAFSECSTRLGTVEYNLCGVTQTLVLVFSKQIQTKILSENQIQIKLQQQADIELEDRVLAGNDFGGIENTDDDDMRILDALPSGNKNMEPSSFTRLLQYVEVVGFNTLQVPAITNLTYFMNQAFFLQGKGLDTTAVDFMTSQLLVTTKRATQAAEMYRRMQARELQGIGQATSTRKYKKCIQCAVYELLIADSYSPNVQLNDKILSIERLNQFLRAEIPRDINQRFPPQVTVNKIDQFSSLLSVLPDCLRFAIVCLSHRLEIVRISALKMIKYMLETLGCSLDYGMVFILKAMLMTYPTDEQTCSQEDFDLSKLLKQEITVLEYLFKVKERKQITARPVTQWQTKDDPQSGSARAMLSIYNHVLDTYISVLSSVSSHILHSIFYDVIESTLTLSAPAPVRVFTCKIADKIFTICQGDLILTPQLLDTLLTLTSNLKAQLPDSVEHSAQQQVKSLWLSIRQKVLPNYSAKGYHRLVEWLVSKLTEIQGVDSQDDQVRQMAEIITIVSLGRQKSEEDANQAIRLPSHEKYGGGPSSELYLVLAPLLYWLEYSIDSEERFPLFMQLYQTIKDVMAGLPKSQADLDIISVIFPALQRTSDYIKENSPNLSMIKFLDLVLTDMLRAYTVNQKTVPPLDIQYFFSKFLGHFVSYLPYSLYEESLYVFEKLIALSSDVMSEKTLQKCIVALVDKYTAKSKQHKTTMQYFMKFLLTPQKRQQSPSRDGLEEMLSEGGGGGLDQSMSSRANLFELMADFCFFNNHFGKHTRPGHLSNFKQMEFRSEQDLHDLNVEKLQFFIDSLSLISEAHIPVFTNLITHPNFRANLLALIDCGESQVRLKAHEIMESLTQYFVQFCPAQTVYEFPSGNGKSDTVEAEFISHERLYISQIVIQIVKFSLERATDCYLQFNSLILLDFLFQNLLPVPTFQNEILKSQKTRGDEEEQTLDVEILSISESTPELDVMDPAYLRMRMKLVFSMWPYVQSALNSPWSNIRSICYGLICSMLRVDVNDYPKDDHHSPSTSQDDSLCVSQQGLTHLVLPMLHSLLSSKESESKAGGLNILGSFCGLSYDFSTVRVNKYLAFFQRNSAFVSNQVWKLVWSLQDDWDITIKEASVVLIQLCSPRNAILYLESLKEQKELRKLDYLHNMQRVSDIYTQSKQVKAVENCPIRSEHARRAISLFARKADCQAILQAQDDADMNQQEQLTLDHFMFSRECSFPPETLTAAQILALSDELQLAINRFLPDFVDKRLTQVNDKTSRRRQIEMELGMNQKSAQKVEDTGFFVDQYADDQIQEIISIFRNDFKPSKNLWIEKQPQHSQPAAHQAPQSHSPDFFQDIYADAIEQFNQHQMLMQQRQQDELQQQVASGITAQSSVSSTDTVKSHLNDSQNSSTPSPTQGQELTPPQIKKPVLGQINPTQVPGPWPTSPVLVSSGKFTQPKKEEKKLEFEQLNLEAIIVKPKIAATAAIRKESEESAESSELVQGNSVESLKQKNEHQTRSEPDFTSINFKNNSPRQKRSKASKEDLLTSPGSEQNKISRKTAQTYLSNLNQGYIQSFDNLKLINNCLSQQNMPQSPSSPHSILNLTVNTSQHKKLSIKTVNSPDSQVVITHGSTKNRKKQTISNSPENNQKKNQRKKSQAYQKSQASKQVNNLADLNFFIKSLEKNMSSSNTPSSLIKKVEEQMRALGVDPKIYRQIEQSSGDGKPLPPQMKLLALNQIDRKSFEDQTTPSSQLTLKRLNPAQQSSSPRRMVKSNDSDSDFSKNLRHEKKQGSTNERQDGSRDGQSSGRGQASFSQLNQPAILTERQSQNGQVLLGFKNQAPGKQANSTRYDSAGLFQFKKGNSKLNQKGYSALASKSVMSPNLMKRDHLNQQGLTSGKMNLSAQQIQSAPKTTNAASQQLKKLRDGKVSFTKGAISQEVERKAPQSTRNTEQGGDRKQFMSPDVREGAPKLTQNKKKRAGHSHNNSSGVTKPALVLQQPSYY